LACVAAQLVNSLPAMIAARASSGLAIFLPEPTMQIDREPGISSNAITAYAKGEIRMRDRVYVASLIATRDVVIDDWKPAPVEELTIDEFAALLDLSPQVVILGTGQCQRMPPPELFAAFASRGIGLEVMGTGAACRTYNLLLSELREVALALIL
jgi:uncharacterized protein